MALRVWKWSGEHGFRSEKVLSHARTDAKGGLRASISAPRSPSSAALLVPDIAALVRDLARLNAPSVPG